MGIFQSSVQSALALGIPGELAYDGPSIAFPWTLQSTPELNIVGATAYTEVSDGVAMAGGTGAFVGILVNPKVYASSGTGGGPLALAPTMTLPDETIGELATQGIYFLTLTAAFAIGDHVSFATATGALESYSTTNPPAGFTAIPGAKVILHAGAGAGTAMVQLNG